MECSIDGIEWATLGAVQFAQGTSKPAYAANTTVDFGGVAARYVRLTANTGWGVIGQYGLSEVRLLSIPAQAREPQPTDGATGIDPGTALSWRAGRGAVSHEVYLGTDSNALPRIDSVSEAVYAPAALEFGHTYYWQIVEVNEADAVNAWAGDIWRFSTREYVLIDGFETYSDDIEAGTTIFDTWIDGGVNGSGSTVGYFDAPFAETAIVNSGMQSMPLQYNNSASPWYSEAERDFETPQDWAGNGADTLVLYVRGNAPSFLESADGSIVTNAIGTDMWDTADQFRYAYRNLNGNGSRVVRVDRLTRSDGWAKAGVMIRESVHPGSKHAFVCLTPDYGVSFQQRPETGNVMSQVSTGTVVTSSWVKLTRTGNVFTAQQSSDGVTWGDVTFPAPVEFPMASNVLVGLAVTSHSASLSTAAEFSNVSTMGNVTDTWQIAEIGVAQPVGNSSESMHMTVEDSTGKIKTVVNTDAAITRRPSWQRWAIRYGDLSGVDLGRVQKMTVGVGSKTTPAAGGTGIVYIDDIRFGRPATEQAPERLSIVQCAAGPLAVWPGPVYCL